MIARQLIWLEAQLPIDDPDPDPDPAGGARHLLTVMEGTLMLDAVGHEATAREGLLASDLLGD